LLVAALLAATAIILAVSGGFRTTVGGLRISARSPLPVALLALINFTVWLSQARRAQAIGADLEAVWRAVGLHARRLIAALALVSALAAAVFATRSAAGADASGYISESAMLMSGRMFHVDPLSEIARGHDPYLTSPLGWRPATEGLQAPTYPPGLPLLMAVPHALAGVNGASALVVLTAALSVMATGLLALRLAGGVAGVIAATLVAFTPVFLYQSIQPMSDVPVTAAWLSCFLLLATGRSGGAGIACAVAVLVRPNLAPLAIVPLVIANHRVLFATPVAIAGVGLAVMQWIWYGSPLRSGYGSAEELFALANIAPNAWRYGGWIIGTAPALLLAVLGLARLKGNRIAQGLFAFAALVIASYLVYAVFDHWSYLRFLLPALAVLAIFAAMELAAWIDRWPVAARPILLMALLLGVTAHAIWMARSMETFKLADQLRRVSQVAGFINEDIPPAAAIVAGEQSGSIRYYTDRSIVRWEAASPESLAAVMNALEQSRRPVYFVLDAWEDGPFRARFAGVPSAALDWPPILDAGTSHRTRLWKLSDRERFQRGENLSTIRLP
jgi:hypothetical protein